MERSSFRARLFFIAGPAAAIVWSVYAAILTADARQRATECDQAYRQQVRRVESAKRRFARVRGEALLAMRRGVAGGIAEVAANNAMPVPASAPMAGMAAVNGAAVVNAGEHAAPVAPGAEAAAVAAETALAAEVPAPAESAPAPKVAAAAPATPADSIAIARAAAAERAKLIANLREKLDGIQVQVDEIRLGSAHEEGAEWVRTVRIQLSGKKELVKKAVASLKSAEPVKEMNAGKLETFDTGETRTTITGTLRATGPQAAAARG